VSAGPHDTPDDDAVHRYFADQVRVRARRKKVPLYQLATAAGMSEVTLHRLLSGERSPRIRQLAAIARVLGCRPRQLLP
jgi:transcriptional regulator with XRE-family HTH domain